MLAQRASNLRGLTFRRSPSPGRIESEWGAVDILAADANAGASAGFDLAVVDELGLLKERDRDLIASMRSSVSARDGRTRKSAQAPSRASVPICYLLLFVEEGYVWKSCASQNEGRGEDRSP